MVLGVRVERVRYFMAAVRTGSLRAAAAECGISQPSIGEQLRLLEEELDVVLLTRTRRGVRPTPAGEEMLAPFTQLVAAEDRLHEAAMHTSGQYHGRVSIGCVSVTAETVVAPVVGVLHRRHPGLRFGVHEGGSTDIESGVAAGDLDLGVVTEPAHEAAPGLVRRQLLVVPVGAFVPSDHELATREGLEWSDLASRPIVTMRRGTVMWERLRRHLPEEQVTVQAMSARTVMVMVANGAGLGILGRFDTSIDVPGLHWVPLLDEPPVSVCLVQRQDSQPSHAALLVRRLVLDRARVLRS